MDQPTNVISSTPDYVLGYMGGQAVLVPKSVLGGAGALADGNKGDIDVSGGGTNWALNSNSVTNPKLAAMNSLTVKANPTGSSAAPVDMTFAALATALGVNSSSSNGTSFPTPTTFTTALPLNANISMSTTVTGALAFTAASSPVPVLGGQVQVTVIPDGTHTPTVPTSWILWNGSPLYSQTNKNVLYVWVVDNGAGGLDIYYGWQTGAMYP